MFNDKAAIRIRASVDSCFQWRSYCFPCYPYSFCKENYRVNSMVMAIYCILLHLCFILEMVLDCIYLNLWYGSVILVESCLFLLLLDTFWRGIHVGLDSQSSSYWWFFRSVLKGGHIWEECYSSLYELDFAICLSSVNQYNLDLTFPIFDRCLSAFQVHHSMLSYRCPDMKMAGFTHIWMKNLVILLFDIDYFQVK